MRALIALLPLVASATDLPQLIQHVKPAVVLLRGHDAMGKAAGNGSGFLIREDGLVVTNKHVVDMGGDLVAELPDGSSHKVLGVVALHPTRDICLLKIEGHGFTTLALGSTAALSEGMEVTTVGNPLGLSWTASSGVVSAIRAKGLQDHADEEAVGGEDKYDSVTGKLIQVSLPVAPGASGSPVVDRSEQVVGVIDAQMGGLGGSSSLVFAIPVEAVTDLKPHFDDAPQAFATRTVSDLNLTSKWRNLGISAGVFAAVLVFWLVRRRPTAPR